MAISRKPKITLKDVASEANMAISTVSMALANHPQVSAKTKHQIQVLSRKLGYKKLQPAVYHQLQVGRSTAVKRFGVVLIGSSLRDEARMSLLHSLVKGANSQNVRLEFSAIENINTDEDEIIDHVFSFSKDLNGLLFSGRISQRALSRISETGMPCVILGGVMADFSQFVPNRFVVVVVDSLQMGMLATRHLMECGNERVGFVCEMMPEGMTHDRWFAGYQLAHMRKGLSVDLRFVHVAGKVFAGGQPAVDAMLALKDRPTAYVIPDVRIAASFINAMHVRGIELTCDSVVMGGEAEVAETYHLGNYPLIANNSNQMAHVGLENLIRLSEKHAEFGLTINVPFITYNLPSPQNEVMK